ncbi:SPOR domain-containing protein [Geofilum rubicundum]|uniref:SPOR domain-containing protein n=1 Tax=Geofilum rubicundum JCM 15548 TaxID=1236989 RepID=A0A0E9M0J0_9BACT|nr:SPOR domain-containing protein [Geofilum rubicundum]GAO31009.1 hypothetical protein JCM15548_13341 [Geofilum rubicundum JCM 15548]
MRFLFLLMFVLGTVSVSGQSDLFDKVTSRSMGEGQVNIKQSPAIEKLMTDFVRSNKSSSGVEGYRIQLYSGTGNNTKQEAQDVRTKLLSLFPNENVFVEYNAPFMRVRVGAFRHKHEALPLLSKLKTSFPSCYIVRDASISFREF